MSLVASLLRKDAAGRVVTLSSLQFPAPNFNGGTPAGSLGEMVVLLNVAPPPGSPVLGGLIYTAEGVLHTTTASVAGYVQGGLPVDVSGSLSIDVSGTAPIVSYNAGLPFTAEGRLSTVGGTFS